MGSNIKAMTTLDLRGVLNLCPSFSMQDKPLKNQEVQRRRNPIPIGMEEGVDKKRCLLTSQRMGVRPMDVRA